METKNDTPDEQIPIETELKVGIYNLFVNLFHNYAAQFGPEMAVKVSTEFLEEIILNFRNTLPEDTE